MALFTATEDHTVHFLDLADIAPVYFGRTYYLAPRGKDNITVYGLLRTALRAQHNVLALHTMHWADEVREPDDVADLLPDRRTRTTSQEVRTVQQLMDALSIDWNPQARFRRGLHRPIENDARAAAQGTQGGHRGQKASPTK
ncbi:hypothetical protein AB0N07_21460 [Streptomyces sp. NPDC051172]|uniref:hypothetical protein n=1 Tax=Streptomyces sp. NPDC051172 TaxID=3155796 RepID=UPI00341C234F